jgi:hypothetical protein
LELEIENCGNIHRTASKTRTAMITIDPNRRAHVIGHNKKRAPKGTTAEDLTGILAERVMKWGVAPDRFLMGGRRWLPRWRFQPTKSIQDAFRLLEALNPEEYIMRGRRAEEFWVRVRLHKGGVGEASNKSKACAITYAIARAIGVDFK